ncbi:hypothetical protein AVEN_18197-1 [Araneus ventricosus]|uniref:Uncharacterized protein n=1 Tax=Araneus ventricosus TaxID=182803 RepID=A0A4Y2AIG1_ARAVE|nr:hypothetical protein AVEN_18197-1 [Araneus ventricosus]
MSVKLNLRKDELIAIAEEMGLRVPDKVKVVDLKALIESSDVYKDDIEFVRNLIDNILKEKKERLEGLEKEKLEKLEREKLESERDKRECELELEKIRLTQFEKQLEIANATRDLANTSQATEIVEPGSLTDNLESLIKSIKTLTIPVPVGSESFNPLSVSHVFLRRPWTTP